MGTERTVVYGDRRIRIEHANPQPVQNGQLAVLGRTYEVIKDPLGRNWPKDEVFHNGLFKFTKSLGNLTSVHFVSQTLDTVNLEFAENDGEVIAYLRQVRDVDTDPGGSSFISKETLEISLK